MATRTCYNTAAVSPHERFAYWQEAVCDSYVQLGCDTKKKAGFEGVIDIARHTVLSISEVRGKSHVVKRRKRDINKATDAFFLLSLQLDKTARISQFGETAELRSGDMALYSSTDPYQLELTDDFAQMVVQLPKARLLSRLPNAELMVANRIDGNSGLGQLVRENILSLSNYADSPGQTLQALVQETLIDLIATGLASQYGGKANLTCPEQQVMLRVKSFVHNNITDPTLSRQTVADEIGMSVRRLNAIFAKEDASLSVFIREAKFNAVANELRDGRFRHWSISEIACKYGFENFQHFSKAFRQHFDLSPREYRVVNSADPD